jgi:hypothetical protein
MVVAFMLASLRHRPAYSSSQMGLQCGGYCQDSAMAA